MLDPDLERVIRAMPEWEGLEPTAEPLTLGITNRNFRVSIGDGDYVVRISGKDTELLGIDRAAEHEAAVAAAAAGVGPEVVAFLPHLGALVTRFVQAAPLEPERLEGDDVLAAVVRAMRAIHTMRPIPSTFDPFRVVREYREVAAAHGVVAPPAYGDALAVAERIEQALASTARTPVPCHNDLLNANLLQGPDRVVIVDYEYAGMGDPFFDLGNFSINNGISTDAQARLLEHYFGRASEADASRLALMRIMSDFREAMWGVVQQAISTLDVDYVAYADRHFSRCLESAGDPAFARWLAETGSGG